jgi:hypothetical protein
MFDKNQINVIVIKVTARGGIVKTAQSKPPNGGSSRELIFPSFYAITISSIPEVL